MAWFCLNGYEFRQENFNYDCMLHRVSKVLACNRWSKSVHNSWKLMGSGCRSRARVSKRKEFKLKSNTRINLVSFLPSSMTISGRA